MADGPGRRRDGACDAEELPSEPERIAVRRERDSRNAIGRRRRVRRMSQHARVLEVALFDELATPAARIPARWRSPSGGAADASHRWMSDVRLANRPPAPGCWVATQASRREPEVVSVAPVDRLAALSYAEPATLRRTWICLCGVRSRVHRIPRSGAMDLRTRVGSSAVEVARHILLRWALRLVRVYWFNPRAAARARRWEAATDEPNQLLGRHATPEETLERWRRTQAAWKAAGRPR